MTLTRSVVVTGGFGALGRAVAAAFSRESYHVARIDFTPASPEPIETVLDIGDVDLTDATATKAALDTVEHAHGGIDVLVNIAGGFAWQTLEEGDLSTWARMQAMNLTTTVTVTQLALRALRAAGYGRIVNVGANAAIKASAGMGAYTASKSGVHRMTEALAEELSDTEITVNAILPSIIDTPANRTAMPDADFSRWVQPDAIADLIVFLASPGASAVTGALIPVTRGMRTSVDQASGF